MEETIQFIYLQIRNHNVNLGGQINDIFRPAIIAGQTPVIRNNFANAITLLTNEGIFEEEENIHFLTEQGFNVIYNR